MNRDSYELDWNSPLSMVSSEWLFSIEFKLCFKVGSKETDVVIRSEQNVTCRLPIVSAGSWQKSMERSIGKHGALQSFRPERHQPLSTSAWSLGFRTELVVSTRWYSYMRNYTRRWFQRETLWSVRVISEPVTRRPRRWYQRHSATGSTADHGSTVRRSRCAASKYPLHLYSLMHLGISDHPKKNYWISLSRSLKLEIFCYCRAAFFSFVSFYTAHL